MGVADHGIIQYLKILSGLVPEALSEVLPGKNCTFGYSMEQQSGHAVAFFSIGRNRPIAHRQRQLSA